MTNEYAIIASKTRERLCRGGSKCWQRMGKLCLTMEMDVNVRKIDRKDAWKSKDCSFFCPYSNHY